MVALLAEPKRHVLRRFSMVARVVWQVDVPWGPCWPSPSDTFYEGFSMVERVVWQVDAPWGPWPGPNDTFYEGFLW